MTTLIGIRTNEGLDGIVLVSDLQISQYDGPKMLARWPARKIYFGDYWALGYIGGIHDELRGFLCVLRGDKRYNSSEEKANQIFQRAIEKQRFIEVDDLNALITKEKSLEETNAFLLAVNKPELNLWYIDEFGSFHLPKDKEFEYFCIGTGSQEANKSIEKLLANEDIDRDKISISVARNIARRIINEMKDDPFTGFGYDIVVITKKLVKHWGEDYRKSLSKAQLEAEKGTDGKMDGFYKDLQESK